MFFDDFSDFTNKEILVSIDDNRCVPLRAFNYDENKFINTIYHYLFIDLQHNKKTVFSYFDKFIKSGKFSLDDYNLKNVSFGDKGNYEHIDNYICIDILFEYCKKNPKDFMQSYLEHKLDNDYSNMLNKVLTLKELPTMETDVEIRKYFKNSNMTLSKSYDFVYLLWVNDVDCPFLYQFLSESPLRYIDPKEMIYEFYDIIGDDYDSATIIKKRINILKEEMCKELHTTMDNLPTMLSYITFNAPTTIWCEPPYDDDIPTCPIKYQGIHAYLQTIKYYPTSLDERKIKDAIGVIDDVCGSYILGCFQYHINEYFKNKETRKMSLKKLDDNKELTNFEVCESLLKTRLVTSHFQKNKIPYVMMDVKAIDIQQVITSCIWALYTDELFKDLKVHSIDRVLSKTYDVKHELLPSLVQLKNEEIASLKQQLEEKEKTINTISYNVETFERAMSSIKKYKNKIPERDALINKLNKQIEELTKENKELKEFSRSITLENEELLEKISEIDIENDILESDNKEDNKETFGINPMDKYLFATSEEQIVNRLLTWFPNSSIFPRTDLTSSNKNSYKGIIVITKKIGHPYFYDIKAKSYNLDVPIAYCTKVSFKELCRSISTLQKKQQFH